MPMPEIGEYELSELQDRGDGLQDFDLNMSEVLRLMNACYAAGKADALTPWPPPEGTRYRHSDSMLFIEFVDSAWQFAPFATDENGNSESYPFHPIAQCKLTIAYLHGELERVP